MNVIHFQDTRTPLTLAFTIIVPAFKINVQCMGVEYEFDCASIPPKLLLPGADTMACLDTLASYNIVIGTIGDER